jgi:hypothetical protein
VASTVAVPVDVKTPTFPQVWTFGDDGRPLRVEMYQSRAEALEAVGLSEQDAHADS